MKDYLKQAFTISAEFEEILDKTDFDSWLESDNLKVLGKFKQDKPPFLNFKKNKKEAILKCSNLNLVGKSIKNNQLFGKVLCNLSKAKSERLNAKLIQSNEHIHYRNAIRILFNLLIILQENKSDEIHNEINKEYLLVLIYNDLSICYAGLENSSISRGYAEEARKLIENNQSFINAEKKIISKEPIENEEFLLSKIYDLYTITIYNQALAERRSHMYAEAEKNLKKIIKYGDQKYTGDNHLRNFNYYSAQLYLSDLYIDQGRGEEAIELLNSVIDALGDGDNDDIRYLNAYLYKISALIDKSEYDRAKEIIFEQFIDESSLTLKGRHEITSPGFKAMNQYARCQIVKVKNTLKLKNTNSELKDAKVIINQYIKKIIERKQKGAEKKAYKNLSEIYKELKTKNAKEERKVNLIKFLSNGEVKSLNKLCGHKKREQWIKECDDLDALENLIEIICDSKDDTNLEDSICDLLKNLREKILNECDEREQPSRAEKSVKTINEALERTEDNPKYDKEAFNGNRITKEIIRKRLDRNEKKFDSVLFGRKEIKEDDNLVEVVFLRRWNSFSPGLLGSLGGGYFLRINNRLLAENEEKEDCHNIVIDPGYNFLQNFRNEGFLIDDIDTIIITHSHLDHCAELMPIMDLIFQINKRYDKYYKRVKRDNKKINLCLSKGAYKKFSNYIMDPDWQKQLKDVVIIENLPKSNWEINKSLNVKAIPTPHMDLGGVSAIGLKIEVKGKSTNLCLGFTGDTPFYNGIKKDFNGCDLLCVHLGSMKYQEIGFTDERYNDKAEERIIKDEQKAFNKEYSKSNHLLFFGTKEIIKACAEKNSLIIVGEFGEELKYGLREAICNEFSVNSKKDTFPPKILPCDIGLYIAIKENGTRKVRCCFCEEFVDQKGIETFIFGKEDAIHYICNTCDKTLSNLQKQELIEHRITRH